MTRSAPLVILVLLFAGCALGGPGAPNDRPVATTESSGSPSPVLPSTAVASESVGPATPGPSGEADVYTEACADSAFPTRQCRSIVFRAIQQGGADADRIVQTQFLPVEPEFNLGNNPLTLVEFTLDDGTTAEIELRCGGVSFSPDCNPDAQMSVSGGIDHDVPCTGEAPDGCATMRPSPPPAVLAEGIPLEVDALDIPIDRVGRYEVEVGKVVLPDGYLRQRSAELVDRLPEDYWSDHIGLAVRSDVPGREPAGNIYREPFDGPEPMTVFVVFEVTELIEPSVVQLRNIVVR